MILDLPSVLFVLPKASHILSKKPLKSTFSSYSSKISKTFVKVGLSLLSSTYLNALATYFPVTFPFESFKISNRPSRPSI